MLTNSIAIICGLRLRPRARAGKLAVLCVTAAGLLATLMHAVELPAPKATPAVQTLLDGTSQFMKAKQPQKALIRAEETLHVASEARDGVGIAEAYRLRALALEGVHREEEAVTAWRSAAAAWERVDDTPGRIEALASVARLLATPETQTEADALVAQAVTLGRAESQRRRASATALSSAAFTFMMRGLFDPARAFCEASLAIREKQMPNSPEVAKSLNLLGMIVWKQGNPAAANQYLLPAQALFEKLAPNSSDAAHNLDILGTVARAMGDLAVAREYFRRALTLGEKLDANSPFVASYLGGLGGVAMYQGDLAAAREYFNRALAIQERGVASPVMLAVTLHNLGSLELRQGNNRAAKEYIQRALAIKMKEASGPNFSVATSLSELGKVEMALGNLGAAAAYFQQGLAIDEKLVPNSHEMALSLTDLGIVARKQGDLGAAQDYHRRALAIMERLAPRSMNMAEILGSLGSTVYQQGNRMEAEHLARKAWQIIREQAAAVAGDEARQAFDVSTATYAAQLIRYQIDLGNVEPAFVTLEEGRAQALQQLLLERQKILQVPGDRLESDYQKAVTARTRAEQALSRASVTEALAQRDLATRRREGAASEVLAQVQRALETASQRFKEAESAYTRARAETDALWAEIKQKSPRLFLTPLTLEQAEKVLPEGALFVAFSVGENETYVFLLRSGRGHDSSLLAFRLAGTPKELTAQIQAFREQLSRPKDLVKTAAASRALFATLFPREARKALETATRLLISPDGPLWEVPFAALVTNDSNAPRYLGADKAITYTQSLTLFAQSRQDAPRTTQQGKLTALVVGNPIFDRNAASAIASGTQLAAARRERHYLFSDDKPPAPLPATRTEAIKIAQLYDSTPLMEAQATEAMVRPRLATADVIHLATHGYFHPVRAMSSGVLLTVPEQEPAVGETDNDGVLQAWEIQNQVKLKAELVVLSACETGRGQTLRGEGLIGMTRALQYAGARAIVASQWKADDQSTLTLMVALHRHLRQGMAKDEALRQAMALVRNDPGMAHPYYWAPFFLTGDPDNPNLGGH